MRNHAIVCQLPVLFLTMQFQFCVPVASLILLWMLCVYLQAKHSDKESMWLLMWLMMLKTTLPNAPSKSSSDVSWCFTFLCFLLICGAVDQEHLFEYGSTFVEHLAMNMCVCKALCSSESTNCLFHCSQTSDLSISRWNFVTCDEWQKSFWRRTVQNCI